MHINLHLHRHAKLLMSVVTKCKQTNKKTFEIKITETKLLPNGCFLSSSSTYSFSRCYTPRGGAPQGPVVVSFMKRLKAVIRMQNNDWIYSHFGVLWIYQSYLMSHGYWACKEKGWYLICVDKAMKMILINPPLCHFESIWVHRFHWMGFSPSLRFLGEQAFSSPIISTLRVIYVLLMKV